MNFFSTIGKIKRKETPIVNEKKLFHPRSLAPPPLTFSF
jgi:hypothetical protein